MTAADFTCIKIAGNLLPPDLLGRVLNLDPELGGLSSADYHFIAGETLRDAPNRAWPQLLAAWTSYKQALDRLAPGDKAVGLTREKWLSPLFQLLGYGRLQTTPAGGILVDDKAFPISHLWSATPIHLLGWGVELDKRTPGVPGAAERAPQAMLQELLNRSGDHLWGMVSNGRSLRLLRDSTSMATQAFVEFDLESMFDGEVYSDFALLFALVHQSRLEVPADGTIADCWLERWRQTAAETGTRALGLLRDGVQAAIESLGTGFLQQPGNSLNDRLTDGSLSVEDYHRSLLRLVYRLLFLFVTEDRGLLLDPGAPPEARDRYGEYFSSARLRRIASRRRGSGHHDQWRALRLVIQGLGNAEGIPKLGIPGLGGIFNDEAVDVVMDQDISNRPFLQAIRSLAIVQPKGQQRRAVDYRNLGAEELGSIYESLLELVPRHNSVDRTFTLENLAGNERKTSGSYYTPTSLIEFVLDEALEPLIADAEKSKTPEQALLALTVCDPACGSGHFLVAAARRLARRLATIRTGDSDPTPIDTQAALHDVIAKCIFGVDLNPMAVELAKVSLWLEAMEPGRALTLLDLHIKCGNALIGANPRMLMEGIPEEAFLVCTGDEKEHAAALRKRNTYERENAQQGELFGASEISTANRSFAEGIENLESSPNRSLLDIQAQRRLLDAFQSDEQLGRVRLIADAYCAAFMQEKVGNSPSVTHGTVLALQENPAEVSDETLLLVHRLAARSRFFHWHLEFPQIFSSPGDTASGWSGGFSCVIGNPPWEMIQMSEPEFFAGRDTTVLEAATSAIRKKRIAELQDSNPTLFRAYLAELRNTELQQAFLRGSGRFPLTAVGRLNLYSLFAELFMTLCSESGTAGFITPTGIATDLSNAAFISEALRSHRLRSFTDFENHLPLFVGVDRRFRFAVTVLGGVSRRSDRADLAYLVRSPSQVQSARLTLGIDEISALNPETGTLPIFRTVTDARMSLAAYGKFHVLVNDAATGNPWDLNTRQGLFNMASDSARFKTLEQLKDHGCVLQGGTFRCDGIEYMPVYEGKMYGLFDHRFGTFAGATSQSIPQVSEVEHSDPAFVVQPRYWVARADVDAARGNAWAGRPILSWRKITSPTNARSLICSLLPDVAAGDSCYLATVSPEHPLLALQAIWSSFLLDYLLRGKLSGSNFTAFIMRQLPAPSPRELASPAPWAPQESIAESLAKRTLELTYTAWDLMPVVAMFGVSGPPFMWDSTRRTVLQAEVDAMVFHLFGLSRSDVEHVLNSFVVLRKQEMESLGAFVVLQQILSVYDALAESIQGGQAFVSQLDPIPGEGRRHLATSRPEWIKEPE